MTDDEYSDAFPEPRHARLTRASEIAIEPVTWAWQDSDGGRIPCGSLSVAAGREGTGKSSFGIWMTAKVTTGQLPGSLHGTPQPAFYVAVEDSWKYTLAPRLRAAGANLDLVYRFDVVDDIGEEVSLSLPSDNRLLETAIIEYGAALVIIDPLMSVIGERIDTHREREVRSALDPLSRLADRTHAVILGIAHFNKSAGTDAASLITGSGAFKNVPRSVFGFARDDSDGSRVMTQVKNSLGRDDLPSLSYKINTAELDTAHGIAEVGRFDFTGTSERSVAEVIRDGRDGGDEQSERDEAAEWLTDYLISNGGSAAAKDATRAAADQLGISKPTLTRARKKAGVSSVKDGMAGGWVWVLEEFTKGSKSSGLRTLNPSVSSVNSSEPALRGLPGICAVCGDPLDGPALTDSCKPNHQKGTAA